MKHAPAGYPTLPQVRQTAGFRTSTLTGSPSRRGRRFARLDLLWLVGPRVVHQVEAEGIGAAVVLGANDGSRLAPIWLSDP